MLMFQTVRGQTDLESLQGLVTEGFCTEEEVAAVAGKPEPFVAVMSWVLCIVQVSSFE